MLPKPIDYYFDVAHKALESSNDNCFVHGGMLYDTLRHYEQLKQMAARIRVAETITFHARQIENILRL